MTKCTAISAGKFKGLLRRQVVTHCVQMLHTVKPNTGMLAKDRHQESVWVLGDSEASTVVQTLLKQYVDIFEEPTQLPPKRSRDHQIVLLLGAQPINVKPYIYAPT